MAATINISEIVSEFQKFVGNNENDIRRLILQPTESNKYMTRIMQEDSFKAGKAVIEDLVQGFQKGWTAKGEATFTPREIVHRRHKIDLEFYPDEIVGSWLGFLASENVDRTVWPITRYIVEKLIMEKVAENRELKLYGIGNYASVSEGVAQATGLSMDGFCTQLEDAKVAGTSAFNFITLNELTTTSIFDEVESFVDQIDAVYQGKPMNIFMSQSWMRAYLRRRRDLHGGDANFDQFNNVKVDGTNMTLVGLPSMAGKDIIFTTPKENFIWLTKMNDGASDIKIETAQREIFVFADWHENVGFGIEEAVFASVPDAESASA